MCVSLLRVARRESRRRWNCPRSRVCRVSNRRGRGTTTFFCQLILYHTRTYRSSSWVQHCKLLRNLHPKSSSPHTDQPDAFSDAPAAVALLARPSAALRADGRLGTGRGRRGRRFHVGRRWPRPLLRPRCPFAGVSTQARAAISSSSRLTCTLVMRARVVHGDSPSSP